MEQEVSDLHLGFDGGQGSLKLVLSITERTGQNPIGRAKYSEVNVCLCQHFVYLYNIVLQGVAPKQAKFSSVKKVLVLALVPNCPETHFNVQQILNQVNMEGLSFTFSVDVKMGK